MSPRRRRTLLWILLFAGLASPSGLQAATPPIWKHDFDSEVMWHKMTKAGVLVVGTDEATVGIDQIHGTELWRRNDLRGIPAFDFNPLRDGKRALVNGPASDDGTAGSILIVRVLSGETESDLSSVGLSRALMILEPPELDLLLVYAQVGNPEARAMTAVQLTSGRKIWQSDRFFGEHEPMIRTINGSQVIWPRRPPVFDSDKTVVLFLCWDSIQKYDLTTGALIWRTDDPPRSATGWGVPFRKHGVLKPRHTLNKSTLPGDSRLFFAGTEWREHRPVDVNLTSVPSFFYQDMIASRDGSTLYALYDFNAMAIDLENGKPLWQRPHKELHIDLGMFTNQIYVPFQIQETDSGLLINDGRLFLVNPRTGKRIRRMKASKGWFRSRFITDGQTATVASGKEDKGYRLEKFDLGTGRSVERDEIEFESTSVTTHVPMLIDEGEDHVIVSGYQVASIHPGGDIEYQVEGRPNADEAHINRRKAAAVGRGIANTFIGLAWIVMSVLGGGGGAGFVPQIPAKETVAEAEAGWGATLEAGESLFILSWVDVKDEIRSGTWSSERFHIPPDHEEGLARGLMKVRKRDGAVVAQYPFGEIVPRFSISPDGSWVVYESGPQTLLAYGTGEAEDLEYEAGGLIEAGERAEAVERLERAVLLRVERLGAGHPLVATTRLRLGELALDAGEYELARSSLTLASETFANLGKEHTPSKARALSSMARLEHERSRFEEAETLCRKASELLPAADPRADFLHATNQLNLARTLQSQGKLEEAAEIVEASINYFERQEEIFGPELAMATSLQAEILLRQARTKKAARSYREAMEIWSRALGPEHPNVATCHAGLAEIHRLEGRYAEAREALGVALKIRLESLGPEHPALAATFLRQADLAREVGDYDRAEELYQRGLAILETTHGALHAETARGLEGFARLRMDSGDLLPAESMARKALEANRELFGRFHPATARCLELLGRILSALGRASEAASLYADALESAERTLPRDHPAMAVISLHLAEARLVSAASEQERAEVAALIDGADKILNDSQVLPGERIRARILQAELVRAGGDLDRAIVLLSRALDDVEDLRPELGGAEAATALLYRKFSEAFDRLVEWNLESGQVQAALEAVERSRARSLQVQLRGGADDLLASIPKAARESMQLREEEARARLVEVRARMNRLAARTDPGESRQRGSSDELVLELAAAEAAYQALYNQIRDASPAYRRRVASAGPGRLTMRSLRRVLDDDEWLLSFKIGLERSYLFVLAPGDAQPRVHPLQIEPNAEDPFPLPAGPLSGRTLDAIVVGTAARAGVASELESSESIDSVISPLALLARLLLPATLKEDLLSAERALVIPDGALNLLPLEALVLGLDPDGDPRYLLDEGPVLRYAPSLASLEILEGRARGPAQLPKDEVVLASVADPRFDPLGDEEAAGSRRFLDADGSLPRLPGTAAESKRVVKAFEKNLGSGSALSLRGSDADEAAVRGALPGKRYVHVATHGLVDEGEHHLFAALALAPPDEGVTDSENDGLLQLYEIYGLDLRGCRLAVLSACRTNRGRRVQGEGVFGLSRGFLAAGAGRVVAAQWSIADNSSAELVGSFFERIAKVESEGGSVDYATLLRDAKLEVRRTKKWSSPFHWAPLILIGAL